MSGRARSRSRGRGDGQESSDLVAVVAVQQPRDEQPQQKELPTASQDIEPEQKDEGYPADEETGPEIEGQEMDLEKTGGEREDGPDVRGQTPSN